jgi:biopolymer transport protein ExbD
MAKKPHLVQEQISPNLIPMIDIMFLLLLFFMLSADMGQRELEEVSLPGARSAEKDPGLEERLTINVSHGTQACIAYGSGQVCRDEKHWTLKIRGEEFATAASLVAHLKAQTGGERSERKVMIRADAKAPYGLPQRAMNACAESGLYKVVVGAALPPVGRRS